MTNNTSNLHHRRPSPKNEEQNAHREYQQNTGGNREWETLLQDGNGENYDTLAQNGRPCVDAIEAHDDTNTQATGANQREANNRISAVVWQWIRRLWNGCTETAVEKAHELWDGIVGVWYWFMRVVRDAIRSAIEFVGRLWASFLLFARPLNRDRGGYALITASCGSVAAANWAQYPTIPQGPTVGVSIAVYLGVVLGQSVLCWKPFRTLQYRSYLIWFAYFVVCLLGACGGMTEFQSFEFLQTLYVSIIVESVRRTGSDRPGPVGPIDSMSIEVMIELSIVFALIPVALVWAHGVHVDSFFIVVVPWWALLRYWVARKEHFDIPGGGNAAVVLLDYDSFLTFRSFMAIEIFKAVVFIVNWSAEKHNWISDEENSDGHFPIKAMVAGVWLFLFFLVEHCAVFRFNGPFAQYEDNVRLADQNQDQEDDDEEQV